MDSYLIRGNKALEGSITIGGNKNAALAALAATLLTNNEVTLHNIPSIEDVHVMISLLTSLGSEVRWIEKNSIQVRTNLSSELTKETLSRDLVDAIRASILLAGPLVARLKEVRLPPPGGDVIGLRRLDTHFIAFEALGARCLIDEEGVLHIKAKTLVGNKIFLDEASVTATENAIMAASLASGRTTIQNAASEPHVQDLCRLLLVMGVKIEGIGSNLLTIEGSASLKGGEYSIGFDYIEAGSFIGMAAATKGEIELVGVDFSNMPMIKNGFLRIGVNWQQRGDNSIVITAKQNRLIQKSVGGHTQKLDDAPWPGFPADLLSIIIVTATQMRGSLLVHEKMYESRMFFIDWLLRMGADIILCDPHRAIVNGPTPLKPAEVTSPDIRAGMALVIAALCAKGETKIQNIYQIERGYENLVGKLLGVGADIQKIV